uniref:Uncharacterized protein n=1 Tax=Parascaris equorum TaxID=6256 RepID=A0A914S5H2_PAREQ
MDQTELASHYSPTCPILGVSPFHEVTDLTCRLALDALFYRLVAVHLRDLLPILVPRDTKFK